MLQIHRTSLLFSTLFTPLVRAPPPFLTCFLSHPRFPPTSVPPSWTQSRPQPLFFPSRHALRFSLPTFRPPPFLQPAQSCPALSSFTFPSSAHHFNQLHRLLSFTPVLPSVLFSYSPVPSHSPFISLHLLPPIVPSTPAHCPAILSRPRGLP